MNDLTMDNTYMKFPYNGAELGFVFQEVEDGYKRVGQNGEPLKKGFMAILDPSKKLKDLLEGVSPNRRERNWLSMGNLICIQADKLNDAKHIVHHFISTMKPIQEEIKDKDGKISVYTHKVY